MSIESKGCISCQKCEWVRRWAYCGRKRLTDKQLYNQKGYCSRFVPKNSKAKMDEVEDV